jgi:hypothetical protein
MTASQLVRMIEKKGGTLELTGDTRIHYRLPAGLELLAQALAEQKEQVRSILLNRRNQTRPKRAPKQAPSATAPEPLEPVYITPACRCSKYPFAHVHATQPHFTTRHMAGDRLFELMKQKAAANRAQQ